MRRGIGLVGLWFLAAWIAPFPDEKLHQYPQNTRYLNAKGQLLRRTLGEGGTDSDWISLDQSGEWAGKALIAVEDQRFYQHPGVDPVAVVRAMGQNVISGRVVSGGSTLSTQVIKMIEPRPRNLLTKVIESFRATQLELRYDKDFILEQYVNRAPFGGNRQGIATASRRYFGKEPGSLSVGEAALLMGLPQSPSRFRPDRHADKAERRRETVLRRMREEGLLSGDPLLTEGAQWNPVDLKAFHFTEWVRRRQGSRTGDIQTTMDPVLQAECEQAVARFKAMDRYAKTDGVGVVLLEAKTGEVRAWVGGWDAGDPEHGYVDTVTRKRAPGSALKPFAYALAMQQGRMTPETRLPDRAKTYRDYRPQNMGETFSGDVSARDALIRSLNMPALYVVDQVGVKRFLGLLRSAGMELNGVQAEKVGLGAVLGGGMEVSLLELTAAYTVFANEGRGMYPAGTKTERREMGEVVAPGVAYWISRMLSGPERDSDLYGNLADVVRPSLAFKTGTSHGNRDAWAIGWNGEWVLGVWVGRMDGGGVHGLSGSTHAAPLLGKLAEEIFETRMWPQATEDQGVWQNRERIAGITDPDVKDGGKVSARILSPEPGFELWVEGETARVNLQAAGKSAAEEVHWFVDGRWIGKRPAGRVSSHVFGKGRHEVRAVFADGTADQRTVTIL
jgi:penicillin-binding protein 1C